MKRLLFSFCGLLPPLILGSCTNETEYTSKRTLSENFINGSFLVELSDDERPHSEKLMEVSEEALSLADEFGCELEAPDQIRWEAKEGVIPSSLENTYHFKFEKCELDAEKTLVLMGKLETSASVSVVEADSLAYATAINENDRYKSRQFYLNSINRDTACEAAGSKKDKPVVVAVIDSGVDNDHRDLIGAFYRGGDGKVIGANFVGKGSRLAPDDNWDDRNGHGTHVAGIVAATANNSIGITGVGSCANVKIMPIRVLGANGSGNSLEIDRGVQWAAEHGADIINLSLGSNSLSRVKRESHKKSLYEYIGSKGVIVFAAAGNDGLINGSRMNQGYVYTFPASYDKVISVAATTRSGSLASFSNRGELVDIAAPGAAILSTYPGGRFRTLDGTSMASPVAAGAYALSLSSIIETHWRKIDHAILMNHILKSTMTNQPLDNQMVASGGVLDVAKLSNSLFSTYGVEVDEDAELPEPPLPQDEELEEQPVVTPEQPVVAPVEEQPAPLGFRFLGLEEGQRLYGSVKFTVTDWPRSTNRIYIYWVDPRQTKTTAFGYLDRSGLSADGKTLSSRGRYYLYGARNLYAEAVDYYGRRLDLVKIKLIGL